MLCNGHKFYNVNQKNLYASLMFESNITKEHNISTGLSLNHDYYDQDYRLTNNLEEEGMESKEKETVPGAYVQYTFNWNDKLVLMGGIRADHSSEYGFLSLPGPISNIIPTILLISVFRLERVTLDQPCAG